MLQSLNYLVHFNPGWAIVLLGLFGLSISGIVFIFEYFHQLSVKMLCSSVVIVVFGIILLILSNFAKDMQKHIEREDR